MIARRTARPTGLVLGALLIGCSGREGPVGINEVGTGWYEVYSYSETDTDLTGWTVRSGETEIGLFDGTIGAEELVVVELLPVGWSTASTMLEVFDDAGESVQEINVPEIGDAESYGRVPDGIANWQVIAQPTPGALNAP